MSIMNVCWEMFTVCYDNLATNQWVKRINLVWVYHVTFCIPFGYIFVIAVFTNIADMLKWNTWGLSNMIRKTEFIVISWGHFGDYLPSYKRQQPSPKVSEKQKTETHLKGIQRLFDTRQAYVRRRLTVTYEDARNPLQYVE